VLIPVSKDMPVVMSLAMPMGLPRYPPVGMPGEGRPIWGGGAPSTIFPAYQKV